MKKLSFLRPLCGALLIVPALMLSGCGGGNSGPIPMPVVETTPANVALFAPVDFGNGQTGRLNLTRSGDTVSGNLRADFAPTMAAAKRGAQAFNFILPAGNYPVSGSFTKPTTFSVTGSFPAPAGEFTIDGTLPTQTGAGSFTIHSDGQTVTGIYPAIGTFTPPPVVNEIRFSMVSSNFNGNSSKISADTGTFERNKTQTTDRIVANLALGDASQRKVTVEISTAGTIEPGQRFKIGVSDDFRSDTHVSYSEHHDDTDFNWATRGGPDVPGGGVVTVLSLSNTALRLQIDNAALSSISNSFGLQPEGSFTLNGTLKATKN